MLLLAEYAPFAYGQGALRGGESARLAEKSAHFRLCGLRLKLFGNLSVFRADERSVPNPVNEDNAENRRIFRLRRVIP